MDFKIKFKEAVFVRDEFLDFQEKTVAPKREVQEVVADTGFDGLKKVTVKEIPSNLQDVSATTAKKETVLQGEKFISANGEVIEGSMPNNGAVLETIDTQKTFYNIPKGYHNGNGAVSLSVERKTIAPTKNTQIVNPSNGKVLSEVNIQPIPEEYIIPEGLVSIVENGTYEVTEYAEVNVAVPNPVVEVAGDWKGTPVIGTWDGKSEPTPDQYVDGIYFNTALSIDEVVSMMKSASSLLEDYPPPPNNLGKVMVVAGRDYNRDAILLQGVIADELYFFNNYITGEPLFVSSKEKANAMYGGEFIDFEGWNPNFNGVISGPLAIMQPGIYPGSYMPMTASGWAMTALSSLISLTPFEKVTGASKELSGTYDGSTVEVTENGELDIGALLDEKKLPLKVEVAVEGSGEGAVVESSSTYKLYTVSQNKVPTPFYEYAASLGALYGEYVVNGLPNDPTESDDVGLFVYLNTQDEQAYVFMGGEWTTFHVVMGVDTPPMVVSDISEMTKIGYFYLLKTEGVSKLLTGTYDGSPVTIVGNDTVDISAMLDEKKLPLSITVTATVDYTSSDSVTEIPKEMFLSFQGLRSVTLPYVEWMGRSAFADCRNLIEVNLSENLTSLEYGVFGGCISLKSIKIPKSLTRITSYVFDGCINLKRIDLSDHEDLPDIARYQDLPADLQFKVSQELYDKLQSTGDYGDFDGTYYEPKQIVTEFTNEL